MKFFKVIKNWFAILGLMLSVIVLAIFQIAALIIMIPFSILCPFIKVSWWSFFWLSPFRWLHHLTWYVVKEL